MPASTTHGPRVKKQTSVGDIPVVISDEAGFDSARLAACCAPVPGLAPVVGTLKSINQSVERVSGNKNRYRRLCTKAMTLVFLISDHYEDERADTAKIQAAVERTVAALRDIDAEVRAWTSYNGFKRWYKANGLDRKMSEHEDNLKNITEPLSLASTLDIHDQVAALQESLKINSSGSLERKRAEEELYRLRTALPDELADLPPPELASECTRLGNQPEYGGSRNDVWKGRWLDKQDVALIFCKEYHRAARDENSIRRFERQIKGWRKLDNPHVLRLHGWCKVEGEIYLVSPWLRNSDVVRYLDGDRDRPGKCLGLIIGIAIGLRYLHKQGTIHGSLKPSNILVKDDGGAVLSDFSLAKLATPDPKNTQRNRQGNVFRYQAPEVMLDKPVSRASDVYSWAMTALEIVTGYPPFHTEKAGGELVGQVISMNRIPNKDDYISPVLDKNPQIWDLFVRCWNRTPAERPTAEELVEVLEKLPDAE